MHSLKSLASRSTLTSLMALAALAACSSGESTPDGSAGGAGTAGGAAGSGTAGATTAGAAGVGGAGVGGTGTSGAGTGGAGGTVSSTGGSNTAGQGGPATGGGGVGGGSAGTAGASAGAGGVNNEPFALKSTAFKEGEEIPLAHKCAEVTPKGQNQSPPLSWGPGPPGTKSYAIVLHHVQTPEHWVLWDIPASVTSLAANIEHAAAPATPAGSKQSLADLDGFKGSGYLGPCPQAVNSRQSYTFTLYALDVVNVPGLSATSSPTAAATAVKAHLVAGSKGVTLIGTQIQTP